MFGQEALKGMDGRKVIVARRDDGNDASVTIIPVLTRSGNAWEAEWCRKEVDRKNGGRDASLTPILSLHDEKRWLGGMVEAMRP